MCVDGESFEMFAEDNDLESQEFQVEKLEGSEEDSVEIEEFKLTVEAVTHRRTPSWNLPDHIDWASEGLL